MFRTFFSKGRFHLSSAEQSVTARFAFALCLNSFSPLVCSSEKYPLVWRVSNHASQVFTGDYPMLLPIELHTIFFLYRTLYILKVYLTTGTIYAFTTLSPCFSGWSSQKAIAEGRSSVTNLPSLSHLGW